MKTLKDRYLEGEEHIFRFDNIFAFLNFCMANRLTSENSETFYDSEENKMYLLDERHITSTY